MIVPQGAATEDAVRRGLRRLVSNERSSVNDCGRRSLQIEIEETEIDAMIEEKDKTADKNGAEMDGRLTQRWPTFRSAFRDNASNHQT